MKHADHRPEGQAAIRTDLGAIFISLEQYLGVPVVHQVTAQVWEIQKRLHIHHPPDGYGILLAKLRGLSQRKAISIELII
jgi:hypothetical protein